MNAPRAEKAEEGGALGRDAILAALDIKYEYVDTPEWGGRVRVRSLTGSERDQYDGETYAAQQAAKTQGRGTPLTDFRVRRVAKAIVDDDGRRVFSDKDVAALGQKNSAVIDRIDDVVVRLSGMGTASVEEAVADLKVVPSEGSGSD